MPLCNRDDEAVEEPTRRDACAAAHAMNTRRRVEVDRWIDREEIEAKQKASQGLLVLSAQSTCEYFHEDGLGHGQ